MQSVYAVVPATGLPNWFCATVDCRLLSVTLTFSLPAVFSFTSRTAFAGEMQLPIGVAAQLVVGVGVGVGVAAGCGQSGSAGQSATPLPSLSRPMVLVSNGRSSCALEHGSVRLLNAGL